MFGLGIPKTEGMRGFAYVICPEHTLMLMELEKTFKSLPAQEVEKMADEDFFKALKLRPNNALITTEVKRPPREERRSLNKWGLGFQRHSPCQNQMRMEKSLNMGPYSNQCEGGSVNIKSEFWRGWETDGKTKSCCSVSSASVGVIKAEIRDYNGDTFAHPPGVVQFQGEIVSALPDSEWEPFIEIRLFESDEEYIPPYY